jgi:hypothetical protein
MAPRAIIQSGVVDTDEAAAYCLSTVSGQTLTLVPAQKPVPGLAVRALTFQAYNRKPCSGSPPMVSNVHVILSATSA